MNDVNVWWFVLFFGVMVSCWILGMYLADRVSEKRHQRYMRGEK